MRKILLLIILVLSMNSLVFGYGFNPIDFGVRSVAMGGTSVASANDATAIYSNPALLAINRVLTFNGSFRTGADSKRFTSKFDDSYNGENIDIKDSYNEKFIGLDLVGVVVPTERRGVDYSYGLSLITEYQTMIKSSGNTPFVKGGQCLSLGSGVKLAKNFLIGYSINFRFGLENGNFGKREYNGFNIATGAAFLLPDYHAVIPETIGLFVSFPYRLEFKYKNSSEYTHSSNGWGNYSTKPPYVDVPYRFGLGLQWKMDNLTVALDFIRERHSDIEDYYNPTSDDLYQVRTGIEHIKEFENFRLYSRLGYSNRESYLYLNDNFIANSNLLSAGFGLEQNQMMFEVAFSYVSTIQEGIVIDPTNNTAAQKTDLDEIRILMGLKFTFK
jgi:hypothetical protein